MLLGFYKQRLGRVLAGVLAGISDRFHWNVSLVRIIFVVICLLGKIGLLAIAAYVLLAAILPFKEDVYADRYGTGPRKIKDAEKIRK
ncbi:PspC domain-containing protein [Streptococcus oriscaviae]|uniref:PspC domain-containing protein n=1 Tax=Streptococcus oriscaviae TaxID=2781599 RepID=A0ABX7YM92_9STRE|nr:PspC domain-containing protein [Streptococcus oriscaviae]QUE54940.1 PspC domain-containing protein [Streptococcus oriscaviae]